MVRSKPTRRASRVPSTQGGRRDTGDVIKALRSYTFENATYLGGIAVFPSLPAAAEALGYASYTSLVSAIERAGYEDYPTFLGSLTGMPVTAVRGFMAYDPSKTSAPHETFLVSEDDAPPFLDAATPETTKAASKLAAEVVNTFGEDAAAALARAILMRTEQPGQ